MSTACRIIAAVVEEDLLHLAAGEIHTIAEPGDGVVIHCMSGGAAWVTQAGVHDDVVLEAGMSFRPRAAGKVVIQGLIGAVAVSVEHVPAGDWPRTPSTSRR